MIRGALAVAAVLVATIAPAAAEPTPAEALARVEAAYAKLQRLSTRVVQVQTSGAYGTQTTLKGRVHVARPDRVRADYDMPPLPGKQRGPATLASSHVIAGDVSWIVDHRARELREQAAVGVRGVPPRRRIFGVRTVARRRFSAGARLEAARREQQQPSSRALHRAQSILPRAPSRAT